MLDKIRKVSKLEILELQREEEKTYKHKPIYIIAKEEGEIKRVLPLFLMRSLIFGKKLVSVPFAPSGGVCR